MAGIYIHIPFCKQACHYCNFHFSTSLRHREVMMESILKEIKLQSDFLPIKALTSIYFGGGTPSLLSGDEISKIIDKLSEFYNYNSKIEITLEANPDDITTEKIKNFKSAGVNRLSVGVQSFIESELIVSNRAHNASESLNGIKICQDAGITNLSIDLIYGMPLSNLDTWQYNLDQALSLEVDHISSYALTVEPATALAAMVKKGTVIIPDDHNVSQQYLQLIQSLTAHGYHHYEISNFAKLGRYAVHNTNYWKSVPYLGIGPSAHSYKKGIRQWNIANNAKYIKAIDEDRLPSESEIITYNDQYNEIVMTRLRTMWGIDRGYVEDNFNEELPDLDQGMQMYISQGLVELIDNHYKLTPEGRLRADGIASAFFIVE